MKTINGKTIKADVTVQWFYQTPNGGYAIRSQADFAAEFPNDAPARSNKRDRVDTFREIGKSGKLAFFGTIRWDAEEWVSASVFEI